MQNNNENDEIEEIKLISIEESIKLRKIARDKRNKEFNDKLAKLQARTEELKKQLNYDQKKKRT